jgi:hypothetical protein
VSALGLWRLRHNTARADIGAADEAQPVDPLLIRQADVLFVILSVAHLAPGAAAPLSATSITEKQRERWARGVITAPTPVRAVQASCCPTAVRPLGLVWSQRFRDREALDARGVTIVRSKMDMKVGRVRIGE